MQVSETNLIVLSAAVNNNHTPQIHYALVTLIESGNSFNVKNFSQMKHQAFHSTGNNDENLKMRFIYNNSVGYVYADRMIYEIILNGMQKKINALD